MREKKYIPFWTKEENKVDKNILSIILLAHVQQPRGYINNSQLQCSETERFSIEEFNEIYQVIIPGLFEPPVRTLRATIPENESHIFR